MLEIIGLIFLCKKNGENAKLRGRKPGGYIALTIALWIGLEIIGVIIGTSLDLGIMTYLIAILLAVCGGALSYYLTKKRKPIQQVQVTEVTSDMSKSTDENDQMGETETHLNIDTQPRSTLKKLNIFSLLSFVASIISIVVMISYPIWGLIPIGVTVVLISIAFGLSPRFISGRGYAITAVIITMICAVCVVPWFFGMHMKEYRGSIGNSTLTFTFDFSKLKSLDQDTQSMVATLSIPEDNCFRRTKWGMSIDEVEATESGAAMAINDDSIIYRNIFVSGLNATARYNFDNGVLISGEYIINEPNRNADEHIKAYEMLKQELTVVYGAPQLDAMDWSDDKFKEREQYGEAVVSGHLSYVSYWLTDSTIIFLSLVAEDSVLNLSIIYGIPPMS